VRHERVIALIIVNNASVWLIVVLPEGVLRSIIYTRIHLLPWHSTDDLLADSRQLWRERDGLGGGKVV
jgi:hypothetical protein